ncbi:hypothetical protein ACIU1J_04885 [Azospirillum doebereinerae]|uniref:hypothetical protein n=1 Tax=Azospirillum doebereinerae TaxID=92933 RepID=UPI001EE55DBF|nr:hypothetical protein [Azospirillum doebereinerae]MCG5243332.1 hypothetical protein [Azospirillum doebereinerae]
MAMLPIVCGAVVARQARSSGFCRMNVEGRSFIPHGTRVVGDFGAAQECATEPGTSCPEKRRWSKPDGPAPPFCCNMESHWLHRTIPKNRRKQPENFAAD